MKLPLNNIFDLAVEKFREGDYKSSFKFFSFLLFKEERDIDAQIGAILSDYAVENEEDAIDYFEYFLDNLSDELTKKDLLYELTSQMDVDFSFLDELFTVLEELIVTTEGIEYQDFKEIFIKSSNKKQLMENLTFSTKLIISTKEDMLDFIELLYENDFIDEALSYLESAISISPIDTYFQDTFREYNLKIK